MRENTDLSKYIINQRTRYTLIIISQLYILITSNKRANNIPARKKIKGNNIQILESKQSINELNKR